MYYTKPTAIVTTIIQSESVSATPWDSLDKSLTLLDNNSSYDANTSGIVIPNK